ncbi:hypothetical protein T12_687 [Trichinella patagoniensis]|uniref:Uncharacterized protein n=1 Tax=Trichinella patagoniensis TaxID=990121 RepID=A0A0V0Z641_9BILA|nr:hypothetical protein T12_687 [Trichinella patagoniensis]
MNETFSVILSSVQTEKQLKHSFQMVSRWKAFYNETPVEFISEEGKAGRRITHRKNEMFSVTPGRIFWFLCTKLNFINQRLRFRFALSESLPTLRPFVHSGIRFVVIESRLEFLLRLLDLTVMSFHPSCGRKNRNLIETQLPSGQPMESILQRDSCSIHFRRRESRTTHHAEDKRNVFPYIGKDFFGFCAPN